MPSSQSADIPAAVAAVERSLDHARRSDAVYELAQTLEAQCRLDRSAPVDECHRLFESLGVKARPVVPLALG